MPYMIYDLVPKTVLNGWTIIGEVVVLLWHTKINDLETYLAQLSRAIEDFLTISAQCAPSILISKAKFHFLLHIPMYIRRFGPAILFSTERFESFNHVFHLTCIHSNRQAPSRDTCNTFASHDIIKHVVTGGFWFDAVQKKWVRAGDAVRQYIAYHLEQRYLLGLNTANAKAAGSVRLPVPANKGKVVTVPWSQTQSHRIYTDPQNTSKLPSSSSSRFVIADSIVATNGDTVAVGGHVILSDEAETLRIGKIIEILAPDSNCMYASHVAIQFLQFLLTVHPTLRVPRMQTITNQEVKSPEQILCAINIQHDCASSQCVETRSIRAHQEREQTNRTMQIVKHKETNMFLLNVHSLHNYDMIAKVIPLNLRLALTVPLVAAGDSKQIRLDAANHVRQKKTGGTTIVSAGAECQLTPAFDRSTGPAVTHSNRSVMRSPKRGVVR
ncbi:uncharacterized protein F5891DRAFT_1193606 [Suillus fuscotomentosus]|uniref:Uncharacterized protein n=1 Tax=Suillus fuscotomentosus TaxID=1912939 RepID=A0AAD4HGT8_9AGAM|nr:uncharacterized protein F5891DRAFT_1193606 [Suillus fuscotomentosus]KAG1895977.1 hypothetical protein F5891DRAFT_1193606 [Suillus fuscotomentosus]